MNRRIAKLLCTLLLYLLPTVALAGPTLIVEEDAADVPQTVLDQLVADYPDAGVITVTAHHVGTAPVEPAPDEFPLVWLSVGVDLMMVLAGGWIVLRKSDPD